MVDVGGALKAPNGAKSNLNQEQYALVRSAYFKSWFGDWENDTENASKVLDENGEPKLVYHGSTEKIVKFDSAKIGSREDTTVLKGQIGFWFTTSKAVAKTYAKDYSEDNIGHYFLNIRNPFVVDAGGRSWRTVIQFGKPVENIIEVQKFILSLYIVKDQIISKVEPNDQFGTYHISSFYAGRILPDYYLTKSEAESALSGLRNDIKANPDKYVEQRTLRFLNFPKYTSSNEVVQRVFKDGIYDGVIFKNMSDVAETVPDYYEKISDVICVFSNTQIMATDTENDSMRDGGMVKGPSHDNGGVKFRVEDTGQLVEVEGREPVITNRAMQSQDVIELEGTNLEVLNQINTGFGGKTMTDPVTSLSGGDTVICKVSAKDKTRRKFKGTPRQIVSAINESGGCKVIDPDRAGSVVKEMGRGGVTASPELIEQWLDDAIAYHRHYGTEPPRYSVEAVAKEPELLQKLAFTSYIYRELFGLAPASDQVEAETEPVRVSPDQVDDVGDIAARFGLDRAVVEDQVNIGTRHELEHTQDPAIARKIALDHLRERPDYYLRLREMELKPVVMEAFPRPIAHAGTGAVIGTAAAHLHHVEPMPPIIVDTVMSSGGEIMSDDEVMKTYPRQTKKSVQTIFIETEKILKSRTELSQQDRFTLERYEGLGGMAETGRVDKGLLHQFYTPYIICKKMIELARRHGWNGGGNVLEPSCGTGRFFKFMPTTCKLYGFDPDTTNSEIVTRLYPEVKLYQQELETAFLEQPRYNKKARKTWLPEMDLVIGNPPYGDYMGYYKTYMPSLYKRFEFLFIYLGLQLLKPGGLLIYIVSQNVMNNGGKYNSMKEDILRHGSLIDAYRLPNGIFSTTEVGTDIIILKRK